MNDLPPIAPQMWHAFHVAGEQLSVAIIAALLAWWSHEARQQRAARHPVESIPVPAAVWLFGGALGALGWIRRKQAA